MYTRHVRISYVSTGRQWLVFFVKPVDLGANRQRLCAVLSALNIRDFVCIVCTSWYFASLCLTYLIAEENSASTIFSKTLTRTCWHILYERDDKGKAELAVGCWIERIISRRAVSTKEPLCTFVRVFQYSWLYLYYTNAATAVIMPITYDMVATKWRGRYEKDFSQAPPCSICIRNTLASFMRNVWNFRLRGPPLDFLRTATRIAFDSCRLYSSEMIS